MLRMTPKKKILFVINPSSGSSLLRSDSLSRIITKHIDHNLYEPQIVYSDGPDHVVALSSDAAANGVPVVVAVGGDGSINLVARALVRTKTALGIIPAGSGNGLAHHLKIPVHAIKAIEIINKGKTMLMDSVLLNDKLFFSIAGVGFDALVAREYAKSEMRGFLPYFRIVTSKYPVYRPKNYELIIDGNPLSCRALFVVFANSGQFGYNTIIAPHAEVDDGLIDVCIARKVPLIKMPLLVHQLFNGTVDSSGFVEIIKAKQVEVKRKKNRRINLDGESVKLTKNFVVTVNPGSLKVITP